MKLYLRLENKGEKKHSMVPVILDQKELSSMTKDNLWQIFESMRETLAKIKNP